MNTFLNALHVVTAVLVTGPLVATPFAARRLVRRRHADEVRRAANLMAVAGAGILLVAGLGVATLLTSDQWTATTPWVVIAATLFVVALGLVWGYAVPALRSAASLVHAEVAAEVTAVAITDGTAEGSAGAADGGRADGDRAGGGADGPGPVRSGTDTVSAEHGGSGGSTTTAVGPTASGGSGPPPAAPESQPSIAGDVRRQHRLDIITARVTGTGWLLLITFVAITVLMTVRPFG